MNTYETSATVEDEGRIQVVGVPFAAGTEVQITISLKPVAPEEFIAAWRRVCADLRGRSNIQNISDDEIRDEIDRYRGGQ